jgi:hypothetical protein
MSEQVFIRLRGRIQGPFVPEQLHVLARRGQFSRSHEISADGVNWCRATTRPELFPPAGVSTTSTHDDLELLENELSPPPAAPPIASTPPPAEVWYYHQLGKNQGPVDFTHLQYLASSGQITADDMVWKVGLPEWLPAGRVPGLMKQAGAGQPFQPVPMYVPMQPAAAPNPDIPRVSGLAVASLVLGILWIGGLGSILAIIFGPVALYQIHVSRGRIWGTGLAVAGLVLGIVLLGLQVLLIMNDTIKRDQFHF